MQSVLVEQLIGHVFGPYRVERFLGRGRLNAVYLVRNMQSQQTDALALYLVPDRFSPQAKTRFVERFCQEAALVSALKHPHILPVYGSGELQGYPYLITPYRTKGSLADNLKRNGHYDHGFVSALLPQIVAGLKYAHSQRVIHGTLRPSTIIIGEAGEVQVAGFGLLQMLQAGGIEQTSSPYAHLFSIANTLLVAPEYVAPELVQRRQLDQRTDIYSLGCILFELLSGRPPFSGGAPLEILQKHVTQVAPSLHTLCQDLPAVLSAVVHQAIERNPEQRFTDVDELCEAFVQASQGAMSYTQKQQAYRAAQEELIAETLPGKLQESQAIDDLDAYRPAGEGHWQFQPPIVTSRVAAVKPAAPKTMRVHTERPAAQVSSQSKLASNKGTPVAETHTAPERTQTAFWQFQPPVVSEKIPAVRSTTDTNAQPMLAKHYVQPAAPTLPPPDKDWPVDGARQAQWETEPLVQQQISPDNPADKDALMEAYAWWSPEEPVQPGQPLQPLGAPDTAEMVRRKGREASMETSADMWGFDNWREPATQEQKSRPKPRKVKRRRVLAMLAAGAVVLGAGGVLAWEVEHNGGGSHLPQSGPGNADNHSPVATKVTTGHQGTLIGASTQASNSAVTFTNPVNQQEGLLVHLVNGAFAAYEQACTHEGVPVNYHPETRTFICPAHGAIFDPAHNGKVLQGPAIVPLPQIAIKINTDGTITTS
jgi:serine/threonine protein kinase/Rieske Fe-S protein